MCWHTKRFKCAVAVFPIFERSAYETVISSSAAHFWARKEESNMSGYKCLALILSMFTYMSCLRGREVNMGGVERASRSVFSPPGWAVILGFSACPLRHASRQGDPFSPRSVAEHQTSCDLCCPEEEKAGKGGRRSPRELWIWHASCPLTQPLQVNWKKI